jgi:hypothetical protein
MGQSTTERAVAASAITRAEAEAWLGTLADLERRGRFFATLTGFLVSGVSAGAP